MLAQLLQSLLRRHHLVLGPLPSTPRLLHLQHSCWQSAVCCTSQCITLPDSKAAWVGLCCAALTKQFWSAWGTLCWWLARLGSLLSLTDVTLFACRQLTEGAAARPCWSAGTCIAAEGQGAHASKLDDGPPVCSLCGQGVERVCQRPASGDIWESAEFRQCRPHTTNPEHLRVPTWCSLSSSCTASGALKNTFTCSSHLLSQACQRFMSCRMQAVVSIRARDSGGNPHRIRMGCITST